MIQKIIKVGTSHCGQCKMQEKELLKLNSYFKDNNIEVEIIDAEDNEEFAEERDIMKVPVVICDDSEGKELIRFTGFTKAEEIKQQIEFFNAKV